MTMRAHLLALIPPSDKLFTIPLLPNPKPKLTPSLHLNHCQAPVVAAGRRRSSRWTSHQYDHEDERVWWSDFEDDDFRFDGQFWVIKIFRWMLPAVAISLLLGTGQNAFVMALAVPLGQTLISLAFDKARERRPDTAAPKKRPKTRKTHSSGSTAANQTSTWPTGDAPDGRLEKEGQRFRGWDDLDTERSNYVYHSSVNASGRQARAKPEMGKVSRVGRVRERPLLLRLLVAAFPFLGSWMSILF